ncbi:SDR family NAD(P)-dependent oxidoreductase [Falsiroseomonas sp. HW251]|uniref:SDR family NAD(P)-dependent oxidoreductase n=1 Tax=Falsiroseomonas sp. HW251 TaxID=3390998 RepID=UPI003D318C5A
MQALIVGAGEGFSASMARRLAREGHDVALAARNTAKLAALAAETKATLHECDGADPDQVAALFATPQGEAADIVLYNASFRVRGPVTELDPEDVRRTLEVCAFGAFLVAQQAARRMVPRGRGTILLTGASAGVKGFPKSSPFAMGKFALRGLGQALARELHPQGVHVVHIVVDGGIRSSRRPDDGRDALLDPDAIAEAAFAAMNQPRSAWSHEIELRPWVETF